MRHQADSITKENFPDSIKLGSLMLPLSYHFDPRTASDGVTLVIPVAMINQVSPVQGDWLVPGLLRDKLIALLKSLPKQYRRQLVPIPDSVDRLMQHLEPASDLPMIQQLAGELKRMTGMHVPEDQWNEASLDKHLQMNYSIVDARQKELASGRNLHELQQRFQGQAQQQFSQMPVGANDITGCKDWSFGDIPESQKIEQAGISMTGFPALIDEGESVGLKVLDSKPTATLAHQQGLLRLIKLRLPREIRFLKKNLPGLDRMRLQYAKVPKTGTARLSSSIKPPSDLQQVLVDWILTRVFLSGETVIRSENTFNVCLEAGRSQIIDVANHSCQRLAEVLDHYQQLRKSLSHVKQINWMSSVTDLSQQLDGLVYQGFLDVMTEQRFKDYLRYLKAMQIRLEKLSHAAAKDQQLMREMAQVLQRWQERQQLADKNGRIDERLEEIRWMLEELRISLFAQQVKTAYPVSLKRIEKRWKELGL